MHIKYFSEMLREGIVGEVSRNYAKMGLFRVRSEGKGFLEKFRVTTLKWAYLE
jgi:hypothetical protein